MISPGRISACLLLVAVAAGTIDDKAVSHRAIVLGGYQVLAADFHVHTYPFSSGSIAGWDLVIEARKQGLDAFAITPHNDARGGHPGQWFSRLVGGPTVLNGEEIHSGGYHIIAVGIHDTISWRQSASAAIAEVHRQGGVAIAAHPIAGYWPAYDEEAMGTLDGAEVLQPVAYGSEKWTAQLREFYARRPLTAIGSSDYHGLGPLGICRTYVFAHANTEPSIIEALRAHRTVVFDRGEVFGDPAMIRLAVEGGLREEVKPTDGILTVVSRCFGFVGLIVAALFGFRARRSGA